MDFVKIKKLIQLVKEEGVFEIKVEEGETKYSIKMPPPVGEERRVVEAPFAPLPQEKNKALSEGPFLVTSPFVGTFYKASAPGATPYVTEGGDVKKGQVLCIVEAMKIMNEIESDVSGKLLEICVEDETYVEYGQVLFKIQPK